MRLLFCVNRDLYANLALNHLLPHCAQDDCMVFFSEKVGSRKISSPALDFLRFYEQELPNRYLFPLYENWPSSEPGRETSHLKTFQQLSERYQTPMLSVQNINAPDTVQTVAAFQPDLIISIRFGQILKKAIIQLPRYGVINLHSGLLPEYRGILATFRCMLHDEAHYGYTLHYIDDASIDTGRVIQRVIMPVDADQSLFHHIRNLYPSGANAILETLHLLKQGKQPTTTEQDPNAGNYYGLPTAAEFELFKQKGYRILDETDYFHYLSQYQPDVIPAGSNPHLSALVHEPLPTVHATV